MQTVLFVGGSSLGHIVPSVAVWEALQKTAADTSAHFVCSPSALDTQYLESISLPYSTFAAPKLGISFLWKFWPAAKAAMQLVKDIQPDIVFSTGGAISVPICYAAKKQGIPIVLHEADAVTGRANRVIAALATATCSGMPVRENITQGSAKEGYNITGFTPNKPVLLVIGGSQGAQMLNEAVFTQRDALLQRYQIIHITGKGKQVAQNIPGYYSCEFANEELPHLFAISNVALSRAGAGVTAELAANSIPSIVVPLREVGHDHQQKNAEALAASPLFTILQQSELSDKLIAKIQEMSNISDLSPTYAQGAQAVAPKLAKMVREVLDSSQIPH